MKKTIAVSAALLTVLASAGALVQPAWARHGMGPDQRLERMTERLNLTPEQQAEIRGILETQRAQQNTARAAARTQIDAVLTEEQRTERDARIDRRIERRVSRIADRLNLTPEQETELRKVMAEKRNNPSWHRSDMREQLATVLTDDQLAELEQMRSHRGPRGRGGCKQ